MSIADNESPIGTPLTLFLVQLMLVVTLSRILSYLFKYIKQPSVIAEVVTGIILGPSVLGNAKAYTAKIFPSTSLTTFNVIANVGLIIFMFMVGLEIDTRLMKSNVGNALIISLSAMLTPFILGLASSYAIYTVAADDDVSYTSFLLFVGVAMSITAFPVLARILTELRLLETRVGNLALSSAAVDDVVAWCILALVVSIARSHGHLGALWTFLMLIGFLLFMMLVTRPLLASIAKRSHNQRLSFNMVIILLVAIFVCAWFTEIIGVHAIFGSFILGIVVPRRNDFAHSMIERIEDLVVIIFLPLYFTYSGLRTNIGALNDGTAWGLVFLVIATACVGKIVGATVAARFLKTSWRESFTIGVLMNTKGLVELIVLNVGLDVGVLNTKVFTIFVIMALVTTFITTPLVHFLYLKNRAPKAKKEERQDVFTVFLGVNNLKTAPVMVKAASIFSGLRESFSVKALILTEISDRPSSYFFSEYYQMIQDTSITKETKRRKVLLSDIKQNAKQLGLSVATKSIASSNLSAAVADYCSAHSCNLLLFEVLYEVEITESKENDESFSLTRSISTVENRVGNQIQKVLKFDNTSKMVQSALETVNCHVAVLVRKHGASQLTESSTLSKVLFPSQGTQEDEQILKVLAKSPKNIQLTILTKSAIDKSVFQDRENVTIIESTHPQLDVVEEAKKEYDLIILSAPRSSSGILESEAIKETDIPVMIVYPALASSVASSPRDSREVQQAVDITNV